MLLVFHSVVDVLLLILLAVLFIYSWRLKKQGSRELAFLLALEAVALSASLISLVQTNTESKIFWNECRFLGLAFISPANFLFVIRFIGLDRLCTKRNIALLFTLPAIIVILIFTNNYHHLFREALYVDDFYGVEYVYAEQGIFFWIHIGYSYITIFSALIFLLKESFRKPVMYRGQLKVMLASILSTVIFNLWLITGMVPDYADFSTAFFTFAGFWQFWGLYKYVPKKLISIAKELALNYVDNAIMVFNYNDALLDCNSAAQRTLGIYEPECKGFTLYDLLFLKFDISLPYGESLDGKEIFLNNEFYKLGDKIIFDDKKRRAGRVLIFNNMTGLKNALTEMEFIANHDHLTGLKNRHFFYNEIERLDKEGTIPVTVAFFNIDGMRIINEVYGNSYGDKVIQLAAKKIGSVCRPADFCARINGDEFAVVFNGLGIKEVELILKNSPVDFNAYKYTYACLENTLEKSTSDSSYNASEPSVKLTYGTAVKIKPKENMESVLKTAVENMYKNKLITDNKQQSTNLQSLKAVLVQRNIYNGKNERLIISLCVELGKKAGLRRREERDRLEMLIVLHNVGLISIPNEIIEKTGTLSNNEWELMKLHTVKGQRIASSIPELAGIAKEILCHHERWDGYGYPYKLKGTEIPVLCRIYSIVDFFVELIYDKHMQDSEAIDEVKKYSGTRFDPEIVLCLEKMICINGFEHHEPKAYALDI